MVGISGLSSQLIAGFFSDCYAILGAVAYIRELSCTVVDPRWDKLFRTFSRNAPKYWRIDNVWVIQNSVAELVVDVVEVKTIEDFREAQTQIDQMACVNFQASR